MQFSKGQVALIASGLALAIVSCIPWLEPARWAFQLVGAGLIGWGLPAPGHGGPPSPGAQ